MTSIRHFNPRTPCGVRPDGGTCLDARLHFNPRTPCGVRQLCRRLGRVARHSNPRTPCGVRPKHIASSFRVDHRFHSTHPVWGATVNARASQSCLDISIHAPRVGCDGSRHKIHHIEWSISIHAPRVGCDGRGGGIHQGAGISIHAPRVGCDDRSCDHHLTQHRFQSTHPVWGATTAAIARYSSLMNFNPRTPCGVRLPEAER